MGKYELHIPDILKRGKHTGSIESSVHQLALMCRALNLPNLGDSSVLDVGCGHKVTQALLGRKLPIKRYIGVDSHRELVEFLRMNVDDPRFGYHHMNTRHSKFNPGGDPLNESTGLPLGEETFDVISPLTAFTHLPPKDYVTMLKILRRYVKPGGRLFFSLFVNELTVGGHGQLDRMARAFARADQEKLDEHRAEFQQAAQASAVPDFLDVFPDRPLQVAMYSREYALSLVAGTGWAVESLNDPEDHIQHYMICRPV